MDFYHIAVQRWPLPWMSRFQVTNHFWNDDETKLTLVKTSGDAFSFPRMDRRAVRIYPNYKTYQESHAVLPAREMPLPQQLESAPLAPEMPIQETM